MAWKRSGIDSFDSWCMAFASVLGFLVCMGFTRADGVMFVALMQEKGLNRGEASWPFNVAGAAVVFMAPVTGVLSTRFSPLVLGVCGSLLFAAGYTACYFSTNIYYLSACLGILKGSGQGMVITVIPALINNSFKRYRATAMGIATTGTPLGGFALPFLVQYLLDEYGLRGTFLVLGAIALHGAVGSSVYILYPKEPRSSQTEDPTPNASPTIPKMYPELPNEDTPLISKKHGPHQVTPKNKNTTCSLIKTVFKTRGFYFVAINQIISLQLVEMFSLVVVDYAVDKGVSYINAILLVTITSGCEIFGRLGFGWVTDRRFLSRPIYMMVCQSLSAGIVLMFSYGYAYYVLAVLAGFLGMIQGSALSVTHVVFADYLRREEIAIAVAFARSFHGMASVARSPIIGYFRDYLGSYDLLFLSASAVFFAAGAMWLTEYFILHYIRRTSEVKKKEIFP